MAGTAVSFATNSLQTANIITGDIQGHNDLPTKDAKLYAMAHANASKVPFTSYPSREITLDGTIVSTTNSITDLDSQIDTFKGYLLGTEQNLDIGYAGSTRRFTATVSRLAIKRPHGLASAKFNLVFECSNPFGQDTSATTPTLSPSGTGRTSATYNDSITFSGTAPLQRPIITITYTAVAGATNQSVYIGNGATGQTIIITRTWAANDQIIIDTTQKTVTVNGTAVAFTGAFPEFAPGAGTLNYTDYFTSRTFNISVVYTVLYL